MRYVASPHNFGTVMVPTSGAPRFLSFYQCIEKLLVPDNTKLVYGVSADIALSVNKAVDELVGDWLFILGDDHTFHPNLLMRLLSWSLPAVVGLNVMRVPPYWPVVLRGKPGPELTALSWEEIPSGTGLWYPPRDVYAGNAGLLLSRATLDRLTKPYVRVGQFDPGISNEDIYLMHSLKQIGINVPIDLGAPLGHLNPLAVVPTLQDRIWRVRFEHVGKEAFRFTPKGGEHDSSYIRSSSGNSSDRSGPVGAVPAVRGGDGQAAGAAADTNL